MAASAEASSGRFPMPTVLLSAFRAGRQRARAMLILGAIYTAGSLVATGLGTLLTGDSGSAAAVEAQVPEVDTRTLVILLLHSPLVVLFWHSPALVHWHGVTPVKSLFFSVVAFFRNFGAMAVYTLAWVAVFVAIGFLVSSVGLMFGGLAVARSIMMPTVLILVAMFSTSLYFTFRDSFRADDGAEETGQPGGEAHP
jgi:hypothetical protein